MQRARRFAPIALMALIGGLALAGCQSNAPDVAVQIGDMRFTNSQVDDIVDQIDGEVLAAAANQPTPSPTPPVGLPKDQFGSIRQRVVQFVVFNELARRYAAEKGLALPTPDYTASASQIGLAANNPYVKLATDNEAYRTLLTSKIAAAAPSEADLREAYARVKKVSPDVPSYDEIKPQLLQLPDLAAGLGLRNELKAATGRYGVSLNPRYEPFELPLAVVSAGQSQIVLVALPLGTSASPAVRDLS
jgi:hypothetical protein